MFKIVLHKINQEDYNHEAKKKTGSVKNFVHNTALVY